MAVRATVATPSAATTANVLRAPDWGRTAKLVMVRRRSECEKNKIKNNNTFTTIVYFTNVCLHLHRSAT